MCQVQFTHSLITSHVAYVVLGSGNVCSKGNTGALGVCSPQSSLIAYCTVGCIKIWNPFVCQNVVLSLSLTNPRKCSLGWLRHGRGPGYAVGYQRPLLWPQWSSGLVLSEMWTSSWHIFIASLTWDMDQFWGGSGVVTVKTSSDVSGCFGIQWFTIVCCLLNCPGKNHLLGAKQDDPGLWGI